ncbi:MAG: oligosaccharide flippase family protein [Candidatus Moranbacteria bacterium]|nr:oligosaccharide flippase family protein [Candidatus Moranbacteria bacterium]
MIKNLQDKIFKLTKKWGKIIGLDLTYFVKNGFWVAVRQIIGMIAGLSISISFARLASQEIFGQYQFVLSVLSIVSILSIPGLNTAITQSVARGYDGDYKKVVRMSFFWSLLGTPILLFIGGYYYIYQSHSLGVAFMIASVFFPFFYAPNTWDAFLQGKSRFDISTKYSSVQMTLNAVTTIVVVFLNRDKLIPIVVMYLASYTFFNGYYYFKSLKYIENEKTDSGTIKYGWFLTKINFLGIIANNIDNVLVGILLGPSTLAAYVIISLLANKYKDIAKVFVSVAIPKMSVMNYGIKSIVFIYKKLFIVMMLISALMASVYFVLVPIVNKFLFGDVYVEYYDISRYYALAILFIIPTIFFGYYAQASKKRLTILVSGPIFQVIRLGMSLFLIYKFKLIGAVISYNLLILVLFFLNFATILYEESTEDG